MTRDEAVAASLPLATEMGKPVSILQKRTAYHTALPVSLQFWLDQGWTEVQVVQPPNTEARAA